LPAKAPRQIVIRSQSDSGTVRTGQEGGNLICYVYVLGTEGSERPTTYVGWTTDLEGRIRKHNVGTGAKSTRGRCWGLLYAERYETRRDAMSREWHLKRDRQFRRSLRQG